MTNGRKDELATWLTTFTDLLTRFMVPLGWAVSFRVDKPTNFLVVYFNRAELKMQHSLCLSEVPFLRSSPHYLARYWSESLVRSYFDHLVKEAGHGGDHHDPLGG